MNTISAFPASIGGQLPWRPLVAAASSSNAGKPAPLLDVSGKVVGTPESRYGMSRQSLQLLKEYDVRNVSGRDLHDLLTVLSANHDVDQDLAAYIRSDIESNSWKTTGARNVLAQYGKSRDDEMAAVKAGEMPAGVEDDRLLRFDKIDKMLSKLAGLHDALQKDDQVETAAEGSAKQAADILRLNQWMAAADKAQTAGMPLPEAGADTYFSIIGVMERLGIDLNPDKQELSQTEMLNKARQAYQAWQQQHPGEALAMDLKPEAEKTDPPAAAPPAPAQPPADATDALSPAQRQRQAMDAMNVEAQYGLSVSMLQLIKSTDIERMPIDQFKQYANLLRDNGVLSQNDVDTLMPLTQRGMVDPTRYYRRDLAAIQETLRQGRKPQYSTARGPKDLPDPQGRIANDQHAQAVIDKLSQLHQVLQGDDRVQEMMGNGLQQMDDMAAFQRWSQTEQKGAKTSEAAEPEFRDSQDVDGIFRVLNRLGVELAPLEGNPGDSERLDSAWKDYQAWRKQHPKEQPTIPLTAKRLDVYA
ncbi:hypothetical protein [Chromobacterium sp. IIBBL 290-4]|uniref:hypothetical protein n=1 Tax=Chromobacterium sp. IIBBL 290-4 TaxID=2953890 RepID=UPI0020B71802|nr:hypothetical protein [Chromobacterium sp. IIBBL 290-4]UTH72896.1 hypothetical protein NKT35_15285 [Chromobacterium sp. IIBBL 290-4]